MWESLKEFLKTILTKPWEKIRSNSRKICNFFLKNLKKNHEKTLKKSLSEISEEVPKIFKESPEIKISSRGIPVEIYGEPSIENSRGSSEAIN